MLNDQSQLKDSNIIKGHVIQVRFSTCRYILSYEVKLIVN